MRGAGLAGQVQRVKTDADMVVLDAQLRGAPQIGHIECPVNCECLEHHMRDLSGILVDVCHHCTALNHFVAHAGGIVSSKSFHTQSPSYSTTVGVQKSVPIITVR